jgi:hypothetical protein
MFEWDGQASDERLERTLQCGHATGTFACIGTTRRVDQSIRGHQNRVRPAMSQTLQVVPPTSSLAHGEQIKAIIFGRAMKRSYG